MDNINIFHQKIEMRNVKRKVYSDAKKEVLIH